MSDDGKEVIVFEMRSDHFINPLATSRRAVRIPLADSFYGGSFRHLPRLIWPDATVALSDDHLFLFMMPPLPMYCMC